MDDTLLQCLSKRRGAAGSPPEAEAFASDIERLFVDGDMADVSLVVEDGRARLRAHRYVIMPCPVVGTRVRRCG
jgi:hypothetical protein